MQPILLYLTTLVALAVFAVLLAGIWNMGRSGGVSKGQYPDESGAGGGSSASLSQKLMRWRVGLQFVAILIAMTALYFSR